MLQPMERFVLVSLKLESVDFGSVLEPFVSACETCYTQTVNNDSNK